MSAGGEETASDEEMDRMPVYTGRDEMRPLRPVRLPAGALKSMVPNILLGALGLMSLLVVVVSLGIPLVYYQAHPPASESSATPYTLPSNVPFLTAPGDTCSGLLGQAGRDLTCLPFSVDNTTVSLTLTSVGGGAPLAINGTTNVRSLVSNSSLVGVVQDGNTLLLHGELPANLMESCTPCAEGQIPVQSGGACFTCTNQTEALPAVASVGAGLSLVASPVPNTIKSLAFSGNADWFLSGTGSTFTIGLHVPVVVANGTLNPVVNTVPGTFSAPPVIAITIDQQAGGLPVLGPCVPGQTTRLAAGGTSLECFNVAATSVSTAGPGIDVQARVNDTLISEAIWTSAGSFPTTTVNLATLLWMEINYRAVLWPAGFPGGSLTQTTNELHVMVRLQVASVATSASFSIDASAMIPNSNTTSFTPWASAGQMSCTATPGALYDPGAFIVPAMFESSSSAVPTRGYFQLPSVTVGITYECNGFVHMRYLHV